MLRGSRSVTSSSSRKSSFKLTKGTRDHVGGISIRKRPKCHAYNVDEIGSLPCITFPRPLDNCDSTRLHLDSILIDSRIGKNKTDNLGKKSRQLK